MEGISNSVVPVYFCHAALKALNYIPRSAAKDKHWRCRYYKVY